MTRMTRDDVEYEVSMALDKLFAKLDVVREREGFNPSELAKLLDQSSWGMGDDYREWFENGDTTFE